MDPHQQQRNPLSSSRGPTHRASDTSGTDPTPAHPHGHAPDSGNPQATHRQPRYSDGFTMIPPNESQRSKMKTMAQKEEEEFQRWKETHRVSSVHVNPERLGGNVTLTEARQKQLTDLRCSKLQKKLRQEELDRRRRQEEEGKLQKMKAEQREKSVRLEERSRQEEQRRREQLGQDHLRTNESFLQRFERRAPGPLASSSATHTSSRSEAAESKQREKREKSEREILLEHKRVNSAFLDKLEDRGGGKEKKTETECRRLASEDLRHQPPATTGQQLPFAHLNPDPEQSWGEEADPEPDYDWSLMKLMSSFPDFSKDFLKDILDQCNGKYEQAHTLLKEK